ncbi:hypothetical protein [Streptococcus salivarius]|uniref:hypothetical protein n=1 Tax=Streptococcus salivarius TaxID=1304 RepID=UPI001D079CE4|nr:hypothetical protein [Streptococcus salivarius]
MKKAEKSAFLSRRKNYKEFRMIGFSLFSLTDISVTAEQVLMSILWIISVLGVCYYIFKIIGFQEWCKEIWNNIKDIKFFLVAIIAIIAIVLICQIIPKLLVIVPTLIGVGTVIELLSSGCQKYIVNKFNISKHLKENKCFFRLGIFLLLAPFIFLGLFPIIEIPNGIFSSSDVLGYYGSLVGGAVTVLGVYWTLNYESKKSKQEREHERKQVEAEREHERKKEKEERRKNSLPILRFTFRPEYQEQDFDYTKESTTELNNNYDILLNTSDEYSINKGKRDHIKRGKKTSYRIFQYGDLEIENLGLGAAILSDVYLYRNDKEEIVNNLQVDAINKFIIPPGHTIKPKMLICSNDFSEDDYLCIDFIDIYSNKYRYEISFGKDLSLKNNVSAIEKEMVQVLPELVDTDNT